MIKFWAQEIGKDTLQFVLDNNGEIYNTSYHFTDPNDPVELQKVTEVSMYTLFKLAFPEIA